MILKTTYDKEYSNVYVYMYNEKCKISWFVIFKYDEFYKRYHPKHQAFVNMPMLKEDLTDTFINTVGSVPYTKEELIADMMVDVQSDLVKHIEL